MLVFEGPRNYSTKTVFNRPGHKAGSIHGIEVCVCVLVCLSPPHISFLGLSLALRSHDQIPASHWRSKVECRNVDMLECRNVGM